MWGHKQAPVATRPRSPPGHHRQPGQHACPAPRGQARRAPASRTPAARPNGRSGPGRNCPAAKACPACGPICGCGGAALAAASVPRELPPEQRGERRHNGQHDHGYSNSAKVLFSLPSPFNVRKDTHPGAALRFCWLHAMQAGDVRLTPESGHVQCNRPCPLCANSGHSKLRAKKKDHLAAVSQKVVSREVSAFTGGAYTAKWIRSASWVPVPDQRCDLRQAQCTNSASIDRRRLHRLRLP